MGNDVGRVKWELGDQGWGATTVIQAGDEGGQREVDGFKRTLGSQTGSLADGLDAAWQGGIGGGAAGSQCFWLTQSSLG